MSLPAEPLSPREALWERAMADEKAGRFLPAAQAIAELVAEDMTAGKPPNLDNATVVLPDRLPAYISWVRPELLIYNHTLISAAQGPIRKGVLHREKTPFIWVPLPGGAKEQSDVPSAGDNGLRPGSLDPDRP